MRRALLLSAALALAACNRPGTQGTQAVILPPAGEQDFGTVPVLNSKTLALEVGNAGKSQLILDEARLKAPSTVFTVKSKPDTLEAGETKTVVVDFVPLEEAPYAATLILESNDPDQPTVEVPLKGVGSTRAVMEVDPKELDFGRVGECTSAVRTFKITSKGTADLIVQDIAFTDGTSPQFSFVGSTRTPATVAFKGTNGLPGEIQLTVKYTVPAGTTAAATGAVRIRGTDPGAREVLIPLKGEVNRAPVPTIGPFGNGAPGLTVTLDGAGSSDPDGDTPLTYAWTLRQKPLSSNTTIVGPQQPTTTMRLDPLLPGAYEVQLEVTDAQGLKSCQPARSTVVAAPAQKLLIEMFWDNPLTDVDLHVLRTPTSMFGRAPDDCHYANPTPDWGVPGDALDNPSFARDALTGYGPELFGYVNPIDTTYRVMAELVNENLSPTPSSNVTVRIYLFGVVKAEFTKALPAKGTRWGVADIVWPSGTITAVP